MSWQFDWMDELKENGFKYFVIKIEDVDNACTDKQISDLDEILHTIENYRVLELKKPASNDYWVVNRDEPYAKEVKKIIEKNEDISLNG